MKTHLGIFWDSLRTSFWFVPTLMVSVAIALALTTITFDELGVSLVNKFSWTYTRGPEGARAILSTVASSMMTVAVTAFSITIVALQLASSQFGPRLLRNFMRDTGNQIVLGTFISTFIYCLLVLRTIRVEEDSDFVPHLSVTCSVLLAIVSIGVLIYFIHHAAASIQADTVIAEVGQELNKAIDRLFPQKIGEGKSMENQTIKNHNIPAKLDTESCSIKALKSGYIQAIDRDKLMAIAKENDILIWIKYHPGIFIVCDSDLLLVFPDYVVTKKLVKQINKTIVFGHQRTQQQDLKFCIDQLVEIAVRALSPGINDPFTAIRCIDRLSEALCHLAKRNIPSPYRYDDENKLRVIANPIAFDEVVDAAFNQIRQYSKSSVAVTMRLLEAISIIAKHAQSQSQKEALLRHAQMIERGSQEAISEECDRQDIQKEYLTALQSLDYN